MPVNPFGVHSPEQVDAEYIAQNFVDMFTEFPRVKDLTNTFINGARGTGKSMLLRSLEPEVMLKKGDVHQLSELPFFAVHIPLRKAEFAVPELERLVGYASFALGEHLLSMQVAYRLADALQTVNSHLSAPPLVNVAMTFHRLMLLSGASNLSAADETRPLEWIRTICELEILRVRQYFTRLPFAATPPSYEGALTGFLDFLVPLTREVQRIEGFPPNAPLFVMLDDADNLPTNMQRVLNSWVSTRSTKEMCLKVSTQLGYATLKTVDNRVIESPHDFAEVNLATVYSTAQDTYAKRVRKIVSRRLELAGIRCSPEQFFPSDAEQDARLAEIATEIRAVHEAAVGKRKSGPARARDASVRYAVPVLMRELAGASRSSHTYSYSGFDTLVDLSSGVVRWFLEPAGRMYDAVESEVSGPIEAIPVGVQDKVTLDWSREFVQRLSANVARQPNDDTGTDDSVSLHAIGHETDLYDGLRNLVDALGRLFRQRVLDPTASEQRAISVVVRNRASNRLGEVLSLGVRLGYLQVSDNAAKEATGGRLPRYVLARRLGPYYRLDVSGYASHISVTAEQLEVALKSPLAFVRERLKDDGADTQLRLSLEPDQSDD